MSDILEQLIRGESVRSFFQPIFDSSSGVLFAVEALSRGPAGTPFESPLALFRQAVADNAVPALERACISSALRSFAAAGVDCRLFINIRPETLLTWSGLTDWLMREADRHKVDPDLLVIEVTEHGNQAHDAELADALRPLRAMGCEIAIDDLGAGSSGLKSWSALRPEFVKVDRYFIEAAEQDPVRAEILRSVVDIGRATGSQIIAEGIENEGQLNLVMDLGVDYAQGFLLGVPQPVVSAQDSPLCSLQRTAPGWHADCAQHLANPIEAVATTTPIAAVVEIFRRNPQWRSIAIVDGTRPVGLVRRDELLILLSRPLHPEIYNRKPILAVADRSAIQVDSRARLEQVSRMVTGHVSATDLDDFIVTERGDYLGVGRTIDLLRQITAQQIQVARQANPLTGLPGNRVIASHVERWAKQSRGFVACHVDLDHFKPFNDTYGYRQGDQVLMHAAAVLSRGVRPRVDFVGHIGGDDFVLLLRSQDWPVRLTAILEEFAASLPGFHPDTDRAAEGFGSHDRDGTPKVFPLLSVSVAALEVQGGEVVTVERLTQELSRVKSVAKARPGNVCLLASRSGLVDLWPVRGQGTPARREDEPIRHAG